MAFQMRYGHIFAHSCRAMRKYGTDRFKKVNVDMDANWFHVTKFCGEPLCIGGRQWELLYFQTMNHRLVLIEVISLPIHS